jgi:hypothetical protein
MQGVKGFSGSVVDSLGAAQVVRYAAWATLAIGIFNLCIAPIMGLVGFIGTSTAIGIGNLTDAVRSVEPGIAAEGDTVTSELAGLGFLYGGLAILAILTAVLLIITSVGLFRRAGWARSMFVIAGGIQVAISLLFLVTGGDFFQLVWAGVLGIFVFVMATNDDIKRVFSARSRMAPRPR